MAKTGPDSYTGRRATRMQPAPREIKMLRPICDICQRGENVPRDWFAACTHDPYVSVVEVPEVTSVYEDVLDEAGEPTGRKRLTGTETTIGYEPRPNWGSATDYKGVNSGRGIQRALRKGWVFPEDLRSPAFPNGIKPRCQFRECMAEDLKQYRNGRFCRELEAKLVHVAEKGAGNKSGAYEIGFNARSSEFQAKQLDQVAV